MISVRIVKELVYILLLICFYVLLNKFFMKFWKVLDGKLLISDVSVLIKISGIIVINLLWIVVKWCCDLILLVIGIIYFFMNVINFCILFFF